MDRVILHSDCNCFYASVEMLYHPELRSVPMAVGGDPEARHGIILTANYIAKRRGVKTGMALWQAREACPDVVFVPPRMDLYIEFSRLTRAIYRDYTDKVESFGLDECWLDITDCCRLLREQRRSTGDARLFPDEADRNTDRFDREQSRIRSDSNKAKAEPGITEGYEIAREINQRIKKELGITVSVGVSWNKIFAKLGSDYKKPDAVTVFSRENYREKVCPIPVEDMLYVGRATKRKLNNFGITTIGELAEADPDMLRRCMGKMGLILSMFARGEDPTPVSAADSDAPVKSIGNSTTTPRDLTDDEDVRIVLYLLSESVATRMREHHVTGNLVEVMVRDTDLSYVARQHKMGILTNISEEICGEAYRLFREIYHWHKPIRSMGIRVAGLKPETEPWQTDLFHNEEQRKRYLHADMAADEIRRRYGAKAIQRGIMLEDTYLSSLDAAADDHMIHPHSYMERGNRTGV